MEGIGVAAPAVPVMAMRMAPIKITNVLRIFVLPQFLLMSAGRVRPFRALFLHATSPVARPDEAESGFLAGGRGDQICDLTDHPAEIEVLRRVDPGDSQFEEFALVLFG